MRFQYWLSDIIHSLKLVTPHKRRARITPKLYPVVIDSLEPRQLLSAVPVKIGSEALVNTATAGDQDHTAVAMDAAGDYVTTWLSNPANGSYQIYAQRYNSTGTAQGANFLVDSMTGTGAARTYPSIAMDSTGDFVIAWTHLDGNVPTGTAQRFNSDGTAVGSPIHFSSISPSTTSPGIASASVAMDGSGDFVIAWFDYFGGRNGPGGTDAVWFQRYDDLGAAQGANVKVSNVTSSYNPTNFVHVPIQVSVAMDSSGDFAVGYTTSDTYGSVALKRYNAAGTLQSTVSVVSNTTVDNQLRGVAMDAAGDFVVTWQSERKYGDTANGIYAQRYNAAGAAQGSTFQLSQSKTFVGVPSNAYVAPFIEASVAMDSAGDFTITWTEESATSSTEIKSESFGSNGAALTAVTSVNTFTTGIQAAPAIAMDAQGDFVVVWSSKNQASASSGWDVYSQQFYITTTPLLVQIEGSTLNAIAANNTPITSTLNVHDGIYPNWTGATIKILTNYQNGQDVLSFTNTAKITGSWDAATGTLTLTGTDTLSNYRAALRSVTYHNTSATPNPLIRTVTFQTTNGHSASDTVARQIQVQAASSPPTLTGLADVTVVAKTKPVAIAPNVVVTEPDNLNIQNATVSFTNWQSGDTLAFSNTFALQHSFTQNLTAHTATLTLTGSKTAANYQTTLRTLTFTNIAGTPNTTAVRVATIAVHDSLHGVSSSENVTVANYVSGVGPTVKYTQGSAAVAIAPNLVLTAPQGVTKLTSATISFTNWQAEDRLAFSNSLSLQHTFTQNLTAHTATLTITGSAGIAGYQALLRSVTYKDVAGKPNTKTVRVAKITVNDGVNTGSATENVTVAAKA